MDCKAGQDRVEERGRHLQTGVGGDRGCTRTGPHRRPEAQRHKTSYKKGHRYLTLVVDHDLGCLVWAQEGYGKEVLSLFLDGFGREQKSSIEVVTADAAKWIEELLRRRCPNARWVMDPFHVVEWINDALDQVRRDE
ncbi:transposase [Atopobium sp. oral taxon 416]|uniref:transposase n=1 Tax=Atopobium sp. oral taxon 416 TaxID=712157 RepID=UPI001BA7C7D1|nr:transposase [Atopobium sp. oral taxon 416]QUC02982.1 transposase [Atopobium sp. oral taxon 416]